MRYLFYIGFIVLSLMIVSCGGGGGSSSISNTTTVSINLGHREVTADMQSIQAIPQEVSCMEISFSSPGETTIEREICDFGSEAIEEVFEVKNCRLWHIMVEAFDENGIMIFTGDKFVHFDGGNQKVSINMVSVEDITPPIFNGIESAEGAESILLSWSEASDNVTPSPEMEYLIFMSDTPGVDFTTPRFSTTGNTNFLVTGLSPSTESCFGVRAKDEAGNIDGNIVEKCATTFPPSSVSEKTFRVIKAGSGFGTVTSEPSGIDCGVSCTEDSGEFNQGTKITLTATPDGGAFFVGWEGDCAGGGNPMNITLSSNKDCTAIFQLPILTVNVSGEGSGTVTSDPPGINCSGGGIEMSEPDGVIAAVAPAGCSETYDRGTTVTLTAEEDEGSTFAGWSGDCVGGGNPAEITMDSDKDCTATFAYETQQAPCDGLVESVTSTETTTKWYTVDLGQSSGTFEFRYETGYIYADQMIVWYEDSILEETECVASSGPVSMFIDYEGDSTQVEVQVNQNCACEGCLTWWEFRVFCPDPLK